ILEKAYPHPQNICCGGIGDGEEVITAFPDVSYVPITPGEPLPFADKSFDVAYSNAVFEHMGSRTARLEILQELSRVAKHVYITIPNRWFPLEHHTAIPLLHFMPKLFRLFTRKGKYEYWSVPQNLQFLSLSDLEQVFTYAGLNGSGARTGLPLGPFSSNLAYWTKSETGEQNIREQNDG
ncbi:MAG: class I SAM-dependent methyltransferase, partial [Robiginitomaculum sp.]|nr:class I SAM-dependent methyltransferase [Robiginitomaculum sp.]